MKPTVARLTEQFTQLIGPEVFAKAEAAVAAAKVAAEAAAKAAAEKAAAAAKEAAAAKAAAAAPATPAATSASKLATAAGLPGSATPATGTAPAAATPSAAPTARPVAATAPATPGPAASPTRVARPAAAATAATRPVAAAAPAARPVVTAPAPPPPPSARLPLEATDHAAKGYDLDAVVSADQVVMAAQILDGGGFALDTITGVDWMAYNEMEVVYDYFHPTEAVRVVIRTRVPRATAEVPSITRVFPGANWHERETHDFFGIRFTGHPNLKPFLLPEDADFHPLRKDYQP